MIGHPIQAAQASGLFDEIHVSSESDEVLGVAASFGVAPSFRRPAHLADDYTPILPVLSFVHLEYKRQGIQFDQIWLIMPCSPMIEASDFIGAEAMFAKAKSAYPVMAVGEYQVPTEWAYRIDENARLHPVEQGAFATRSQDIVPSYFDAGAFAVLGQKFLEENVGVGANTQFLGYKLPRYKALDIDDQESWELAEKIFMGSRQIAMKLRISKSLNFLKRGFPNGFDKGCDLRSVNTEHVTQRYVDGLNDPEVHKFLSGPGRVFQTMDTVSSFVRSNYESDDSILFGIFCRDVHIGNIRVHDIDGLLRQAYLGIVIFDKFYWSKGIATKALKHAVDLCVSFLDLQTILAGVNQENIASQTVFDRAGFKKCEDSIFWSYVDLQG